jgi:hypothetical protein
MGIICAFALPTIPPLGEGVYGNYRLCPFTVYILAIMVVSAVI